MSSQLSELAKRVLPTPLVNSIRHRRHPRWALWQDDMTRGNAARQGIIRDALAALVWNGISGDYVEFGCHGAVTFRYAYDELKIRAPGRHMWAFDSFAGLPEWSDDKDSHPRWTAHTLVTGVAKFHELCRSHGMPPGAYTAVEGFYEDTLTADTARLPSDIALAYVDCDMYSSTKTVLEFLRPRLKHGMVIAFDDYFCWSADQPAGERLALLEVLGDDQRWSLMHYRDYGWGGRAFLVEDAELLRPGGTKPPAKARGKTTKSAPLSRG